MSDRNCMDCGTAISRRAQRCRPCARIALAKDERVNAKRRETVRAQFKDPARSYALRRSRSEAGKRLGQDPEVRARRAAYGRIALSDPERQAKLRAGRDAESYRRAGRAISAAKLAHIPHEYRQEYRALVTKGFRKAEATAAIMNAVERDRERIRRELMQAGSGRRKQSRGVS